jgi:O-Antigen ligase
VVAFAGLGIVLSITTPLGSRALSTFDADSGTARGRVAEWQVATRAIVERPWLGAGPEGYRVVFPEVVDRDYARRYGREVATDRAHDSLLDTGIAGGIPALLALAVVLGCVVVASWRAIRGGPVLVAAVGAGVLAYAVQQLFLFPLSEVDPLFWLLAGVVVARTAAPFAQRRVRMRRAIAVPIACALVVVAGYGSREIASDHWLRTATRAAERGDDTRALAAADRATQLRPDSIRAWYVAARVAATGATIRDVDTGLDRIDAALARSRRDPILRAERADLLLDRAQRSGDRADLARAIEALTALTRDDPQDGRHHLQLGVAYALQGRDRDAEQEFRIAQDLAPESAAPAQNLARLRSRQP